MFRNWTFSNGNRERILRETKMESGKHYSEKKSIGFPRLPKRSMPWKKGSGILLESVVISFGWLYHLSAPESLWDFRRIQNLCQLFKEINDPKGGWDGGKGVPPKSKKIRSLLSFILSFKIQCLPCAWRSQSLFSHDANRQQEWPGSLPFSHSCPQPLLIKSNS